MMQKILMAVFVTLAAVSPSSAYLVSNYEFNNDLAGWTQTAGTWTHQPADGVFGLGSAEVSAAVGPNALNQCAELTGFTPGKSLYYIAFARTVNHTNPVQMSLELFNSNDCTGGAIDTSHYQSNFPPLDAWGSILQVVTSIPAGGASSAKVWLTAHGTNAGEVTRFDFAGMTQNLLPNTAFTSNLDGWVTTPFSWTHASNDGHGTPLGSAEVTVDTPDCGGGNTCAFISQCADLNNMPRTQTYFAGFRLKALTDMDDYVMSLFFHENNDCTGSVTLEEHIPADVQALNTWQLYGRGFLGSGLANSVSVFVGLNDGTLGSQFRVDAVYFTPSANASMFSHGFDAGDTIGWTSVSP